jgi:hypothetical protein
VGGGPGPDAQPGGDHQYGLSRLPRAPDVLERLVLADLYRVLLERDAQLLGLPALVREALRGLHAEATDRAVLAELDEFYGPGRPAGADPALDAEG